MPIIVVKVHIEHTKSNHTHTRKDDTSVDYVFTRSAINTDQIDITVTDCNSSCDCKNEHESAVQDDTLKQIQMELDTYRAPYYEIVNNIKCIIQNSTIGKIQAELDSCYDAEDKTYGIRKILEDIPQTPTSVSDIVKNFPLSTVFTKVSDDCYEAYMHIGENYVGQYLNITVNRSVNGGWCCHSDPPTKTEVLPVELTFCCPAENNPLFKSHHGYITFRRTHYNYVYDNWEWY